MEICLGAWEGNALSLMFSPSCDQSEQKCGQGRFQEIFQTLKTKMGASPVQLLQHVKLTYTKPDGKQVLQKLPSSALYPVNLNWHKFGSIVTAQLNLNSSCE
jgi:hypothetical protein